MPIHLSPSSLTVSPSSNAGLHHCAYHTQPKSQEQDSILTAHLLCSNKEVRPGLSHHCLILVPFTLDASWQVGDWERATEMVVLLRAIPDLRMPMVVACFGPALCQLARQHLQPILLQIMPKGARHAHLLNLKVRPAHQSIITSWLSFRPA